MTTLRLFWPPGRSHRIAVTELCTEDVSDVVHHVLDEVHELAALADTISSIEDREGLAAPPALARAAREEAAALLREIAGRLPGPEAEVVAMRAAALDGGSF